MKQNSPERAKIRAIRATHHQRERQAAQAPIEAAPETAPAAPLPPSPEPTAPEPDATTFDLNGNWMQKRAEVRDALNLAQLPQNKDHARAMLRAAGYTVEG